MAGKNAYLKKQLAERQAVLDIGEELGMQKMWDYIQIVLRDPEIMGRDTFGKERINRIFNGLKELADHYHVAFTDDKEADYYQEKLDAALREIHGDELQVFYERYPYIKKMDYNKSRKSWR